MYILFMKITVYKVLGIHRREIHNISNIMNYYPVHILNKKSFKQPNKTKIMSNELLWLLFLLLDLSLVIIVYKIFGKNGLYAIISMSIILANLQVMKIIDFFGFSVTLGNVLYGSIFLATDILSEFHGKKEAKKAVFIGFAVMIISTLYFQLTLLFQPSADDFVHNHFTTIFSFLPRIVIASLTAYLISQLHDVWAYNFWKNKTKGKMLWLRNNLSTLVSQFLDTSIFCVIAFLGVFSMNIFWQIFISTYLMKFIIGIIDTPFIYFVKAINKKQKA